MTLAFLQAQDRGEDFKRIEPESDAVYDEVIKINLSEIEPMVALPIAPDQ